MKNHIAQGTWTPRKAKMHIDLLELRVVHWACSAFLPLIPSPHIQVMSDNMRTVFYTNKQRGTRSLPICVERVDMVYQVSHNSLAAAYLSGMQKSLADSLRRHFSTDHKWAIHNSVLNEIINQWGTPSKDLFVSQGNRKLSLYCFRAA